MKVGGPPSAGAFKAKSSGNTAFKKFYQRGDFPIALEHDTKGNKIAWKVCLPWNFLVSLFNLLTQFWKERKDMSLEIEIE